MDVVLDGHKLIEEVAAVHVEVSHSVIVFVCALVENLLVIDIAFLDAKDIIENVGGEDGVSHPGDIRNVVFLPLFDIEVNIDAVFAVINHRVGYDFGIAVAFLVVFVDDELEVGFVVFGDEFLLREEFDEAVVLVGFLHSALDGTIAHSLVAGDVDFVHLHLVVLIYRYFDNHLVLV